MCGRNRPARDRAPGCTGARPGPRGAAANPAGAARRRARAWMAGMARNLLTSGRGVGVSHEFVEDPGRGRHRGNLVAQTAGRGGEARVGHQPPTASARCSAVTASGSSVIDAPQRCSSRAFEPWSAPSSTQTCGTPWDRALSIVAAPPCDTMATQCGISAPCATNGSTSTCAGCSPSDVRSTPGPVLTTTFSDRPRAPSTSRVSRSGRSWNRVPRLTNTPEL